MIIQQLHIEDYGALAGVHDVSLDGRGLVLVLGENRDEPRMNSNGAGKSTLFDALDWGLFGEVPRSDHVDSVIFDGAPKCAVEVRILTDDQRVVVISRSRTRGKRTDVSWTIDGTIEEALDAGETQRRLEELLGLDREVFHAAVYFSQQSVWDFMGATDAQRVDILTKILGLGDLEPYREAAKARIAAVDQRVEEWESRSQWLHGELEALRSTDFSAQAAWWEEKRQRQVTQLGNRIACDEQSLASLPLLPDANGVPVEVRLRDAQRRSYDLSRTSGERMAPHRAAVAEARSSLEQWRVAQGKAMASAQAARGRIAQLSSQSGATCSACGQVITGDHVARESAVAAEQLRAAEAEAEAARAAVAQWQAAVEQREAGVEHQRAADQSTAAAIAEEVWVLSQEQAQGVSVAQRRQQLAQEIKRARREFEAMGNECNPIEQQIATQHQRMRAAEHEIAQAQETMDRHRAERPVYEFWLSAFGPKGLVSYVLDYRLNEMTETVNRWVQLLTGGTFWVRFETQTVGRSTGKAANKINCRVFRWNPDGTIAERNYRSWSGGEKRRVAWAVDFGLSRIVAARARQSYDLLILDEVFKHVDRAGGEAVVEMLRGLRGERRSIFVVEHDGTFQSHFDRTVTVVRQGGRSKIETEGRDGDESGAQSDGGAGREGKSEGGEKPVSTKKRKRRAPAEADA